MLPYSNSTLSAAMHQLNCSSQGLWNSLPDQLGCPEAVLCGNNNMSWPLVNASEDDLDDLCLSLSEYLIKYRGDQRSSIFLPVCVAYLIIFVVGVLGNALTCTVIVHHKVMWTPTNFYLFSLAVSDLLVLLLGMPLELYDMWHNYPFLLGDGGCYFKTFLFETVCFASVLNVTALSVERYVAVVHPLKVKHVATRTHAKRVILALWALSMLCAIPNTSLHGVTLLTPAFGQAIPESAICAVVKPVWMYHLIILVTTLVFFLLPMLTISLLYLLIGFKLNRDRSLRGGLACMGAGLEQGRYSRAPLKKQRTKHWQVTKMLCVLVIVFGICWAPFHIDRLMWSYSDETWTAEHHQVFESVHIVSGVFFYLSSAVNPVLYNLMSTRFREMFRQVTYCSATGQDCTSQTSIHTRSTLVISGSTLRNKTHDRQSLAPGTLPASGCPSSFQREPSVDERGAKTDTRM